MMTRRWLECACVLAGSMACAPSADVRPDRPGGPYLGQQPPGAMPELFAPGIVSTGMYTRDVAMTPDQQEIYFTVMVGGFSVIMSTRRGEGVWTEPEVAPFSGDPRFFDAEPAISPDGQRLFFLSTRLPEGRNPTDQEIRAWTNEDIWVVDRQGNTWGEPHNLGPPVNTSASEFFPSMTRDGTLYFTRGEEGESHIYRSRITDGRYAEPERLGPEVNSTPSQYNAFVHPDERYVILCTGDRDDTVGGSDYYVVFRNEDDTWSEPINLGEPVNTAGSGEISPYVSPDGAYFFFMSSRGRPPESYPPRLTRGYLWDVHTGPGNGAADIYWMDASFIEGLRPAAR
ncbi:MAG: hypothetical protein P8170_05215 [Gemmatimonadota bacterium]